MTREHSEAAGDAAVRAEVERRLAARRAELADASRRAGRLSNARLAVFLGGVALAVAAWASPGVSGHALWPVAAGFVALVVAHDRVLGRRRRAERAAAWWDDALARLEHRFAGRGAAGERFRDPHHPYADDLDLFGAGGLFEWLCRARTSVGEATLAAWLLAPAAPDTVQERQAAVADLRGRVDLREALALAGERAGPGLHPEALARWGEEAGTPAPMALRVAAAAIGALSASALAALVAGVPALIPWLLVLLAGGVLAASARRRVRAVLRGIDDAVRDLDLLASILAVLERERFEAPRLVALQRLLAAEATERDGAPPPASRAIDRLRLLAQLLDARRNQLFAPLGAALLFTTQIALAVEAWRARHGPRLREWLAAVGELEALASLATHAFEHPADAMPELVPAGAGPCFEASGLGHVLLPEARCVRNDVRLGPERRLLLVSGSNMSGKSTLLRSAGTSIVLAQAGAPVRAAGLRLSPLALGASIRVNDSLQEGASRFYAEIQRLRQIVDQTAGERPVCFLLDEILHGTNSHDRRIGAEAVVRSLLARGAIGFVTTHDLALARIAEDPSTSGANVHFEDEIEDGRVRFDYRMRPGVVTRSNALELMRAVGLDV